MKRMIKCSTQDKQVKRAFDKVLKFQEGDYDEFLDALRVGYSNEALPSCLRDMDYHDMMELAEQYVESRKSIHPSKPKPKSESEIFCEREDKKLVNRFIEEYSALLHEFYGELLDIPPSKYNDYISGCAYSLHPDMDLHITMGPNIYKLEDILYYKGYIDEPSTSCTIEFLKPMFERYGLHIQMAGAVSVSLDRSFMNE